MELISQKKNPEINSRSKHYKKQSKFEGSDRQIRGRIIRLLVQNKSLSSKKLEKIINDYRTNSIINILIKEKMLVIKDNKYQLP